MSDTPRTDNACGWPVGHHGRIECSDLRWSPDGPFIHSVVAREIERENSALRKALEEAFAESDDTVRFHIIRNAVEALKEAQP